MCLRPSFLTGARSRPSLVTRPRGRRERPLPPTSHVQGLCPAWFPSGSREHTRPRDGDVPGSFNHPSPCPSSLRKAGPLSHGHPPAGLWPLPRIPCEKLGRGRCGASFPELMETRQPGSRQEAGGTQSLLPDALMDEQVRVLPGGSIRHKAPCQPPRGPSRHWRASLSPRSPGGDAVPSRPLRGQPRVFRNFREARDDPKSRGSCGCSFSSAGDAREPSKARQRGLRPGLVRNPQAGTDWACLNPLPPQPFPTLSLPVSDPFTRLLT